MVNNDQTVTVKLIPENIREIEAFVDRVCDQLFINDTYYGNILMSLTEMFNYLLGHNSVKKLEITYNSNYENIIISFYPVDNQILESFGQKIDIDNVVDEENHKNHFLIHSLVDTVHVSENEILSLEFDISALHNEIYQSRKSLLKDYFSKQEVGEKVKQQND